MEKKEFKKKFPKLAAEIESGEGKAAIEFGAERPAPSRKFAGHEPVSIDFIRRCTTEDQAYEIIEYLEKRGEVTKEAADELCKQLREEGLRSFGREKEHGFYEREG
ncbi:MAG: DUF2095 family protein [Candidatus Bathyarchaeota archaeon]